MREAEVGAGDRRLFEFLAASRPDSERKGTAAALAASLAGHGVLLGLIAWATVAAHRWAPPEDVSTREDFVVLLSPRQSLNVKKHAFAAARTHADDDIPPGERDAEAAPSADPLAQSAREAAHPVHAMVKILAMLPPPSPDPAADMAEVTRHADLVVASLHESEYGGIGEDSATTRVASIVDDHHEPTTDELERDGPRIGSFTAPPELANTEQVQRLLTREYPELLKDSGVGGRVLLWFLVDETGKVRRWLLKASSGHAALDKVAMKAATMVRFRPAWNYDRHVPLWIVLPITFVVDAG